MIIELYIFSVFILSGFLQTVTGFGYAIITAPLLALVLEAKETVMLVMVTGLIIRLFLIRVIKKDGSFKAIFPLITASV
ncbi:MAG: family transporter, partial [Massilibacillus sp.]|nr:family transporter [Massilibacillus sp.]